MKPSEPQHNEQLPISRPVRTVNQHHHRHGSQSQYQQHSRFEQLKLSESQQAQELYNEKLNAAIDNWLLQPMEPVTFCIKWLPEKYNLEWGDRHARETACQMLSYYTGHAPSTWNSWLSKQEKIPIIIKRYLKIIDLVWQLKRLLPLPLTLLT